MIKQNPTKEKQKERTGDAGKGKPQAKQLGEAEANATEGRELRQQNSDPKEPEIEPQKHLEEFEKLVIKHMKEKKEVNNPIEELDALINTLKRQF